MRTYDKLIAAISDRQGARGLRAHLGVAVTSKKAADPT